MQLKDKYDALISFFSETMPNPETELQYSNEFELIVAVILSAQCTDKRVNQITPRLFCEFGSAEKLACASIEQITSLIKQCSYPNSKAKYLKGMATKLIKEYQGKLPQHTDLLQTLPGVGRKTAHVVSSVLHNAPVFPVDTHVYRVARRIGLAPGARNILETEQQLTLNIPEKLIPKAHHWLILHGRYICKARKPLCSKCGLEPICAFRTKE